MSMLYRISHRFAVAVATVCAGLALASAAEAVAAPIPAEQSLLPAYVSCLNVTIGGRRGRRLPTYPAIASAYGNDAVKPAVVIGVPAISKNSSLPFGCARGLP